MIHEKSKWLAQCKRRRRSKACPEYYPSSELFAGEQELVFLVWMHLDFD